MFGILITGIGSVIREIGTAIGKEEFNHDREDVFSMGFINALIGTGIFVVISLITKDFTIAVGSYPTLLLRLVLEITLSFIVVEALVKASRSTFTFLRVLTLPLLLVVDVFVGYTISWQGVTGIIFITIGLLFLYLQHSLQKEGQWWVVISALLAVATISLYKYNITFYNSVAAEQTVMLGGKMIALFCAALFLRGHNPLTLLKTPRHMLQAFTTGVGGSIISYAYVFAPASVIMSAKRSLTILSAIISGHHYFKEQHVLQKITAFIIVSIGIILIAL
jgi:drug/metabolite transporter (DMT)-like permease